MWNNTDEGGSTTGNKIPIQKSPLVWGLVSIEGGEKKWRDFKFLTQGKKWRGFKFLIWGTKWRDFKLPSQQFCWVTQPRELVLAVELLQLSLRWAICFKLQGANSGGCRGMKGWEGFEKRPCCGGLCTSVGAERPQPRAKWQMILPWNVFRRNRRRSLSVWSELIYCRRNLQLLADWKPGLVLPSDGWMEFRSLILSPEMPFKSTDTFSQQVKLECHSAGSSLPPCPLPSHRSLSSLFLAAMNPSTFKRRCQEQGNGSKLTESRITSDRMEKFFPTSMVRPWHGLTREVWWNGLGWEGP